MHAFEVWWDILQQRPRNLLLSLLVKDSWKLASIWQLYAKIQWFHFFRTRCIYKFLGLMPVTEFFHVQNLLCVQDLRYPIIGSVTARHSSSAWASARLRACGVVQGMQLRNFRRGRHLYSAWRPSCWASTHILVKTFGVLSKDTYTAYARRPICKYL